jgi:hypothetical protein
MILGQAAFQQHQSQEEERLSLGIFTLFELCFGFF